MPGSTPTASLRQKSTLNPLRFRWAGPRHERRCAGILAMSAARRAQKIEIPVSCWWQCAKGQSDRSTGTNLPLVDGSENITGLAAWRAIDLTLYASYRCKEKSKSESSGPLRREVPEVVAACGSAAIWCRLRPRGPGFSDIGTTGRFSLDTR